LGLVVDRLIWLTTGVNLVAAVGVNLVAAVGVNLVAAVGVSLAGFVIRLAIGVMESISKVVKPTAVVVGPTTEVEDTHWGPS